MIRIEITNEDIIAKLQALQRRMSDLSPLMAQIAGIMMASVEENFAQEGRPKWAALKPSTLAARAKKGHTGLILQDSGNLAKSMVREFGKNYAAVGTNDKDDEVKKYAAVHQFGFQGSVTVKAHERKTAVRDAKGKIAKRKSSVSSFTKNMNIPARPFLTLTDKDVQKIIAAIEKYEAL
ncbi:MAG: phage virion morphogenesis protein [Candidatus Magnetominusculus sp. LBB02]|nr:phage virion morphogenesis protein [Candidatus Magnetominusculus sp. LBB02]